MTAERSKPVSDPPAGDDRLVIYPSRTKAALVLLGAVAFVVAGIGIWMVSLSGRMAVWQVVIATYVGVPFFASCAVYAGYRLASPKPAVTIDAAGITDTASALGAGRLRWDEIDHVVVYRFSGQPMLGIIPRDLDAFLARQGAVRRRLTRLNLALGAAPINIPQVLLPMAVAELAGILQARHGVRVEAGP